MPKIILGCKETLDQASSMLGELDGSIYTKILTPYFMSSIGEHMRHILDHFIAVKEGIASNRIDYDVRKRGSLCEQDRDEAIHHIGAIKDWLESLSLEQLDRDISVKTEITFLETNSIIVKSSVSRELAFVLSHTVHHFSMIAVALKMQGVTVEKNFGLAPATISCLKNQEQ